MSRSTIGTTPPQACPDIIKVFDVLGRVWTGVILDTLSQRPARFKELKRAISGISDRMLSERLHELADNGLIIRRQVGEGSPVYVLTADGNALVPVFDQMREWWKARTSAPARFSAAASSGPLTATT